MHLDASQCGILNYLYFYIFLFIPFYSESPSNNQTTALYRIKAVSFQYIIITDLKY